MWWEEFEQGTPKDGRSVKNICFLLETSWFSALNFSCSEVTHIQGKTSSYWWLTCHGPSKSPHVLGNVIFWRVVNLFKGERLGRGQKSARVELLALLQRQQKDWKIEVLGKSHFFWPQGKYQILIHTEKEKNLYLTKKSTTKPIHEAIV